MVQCKITRLEPKIHQNCEDRTVYNGFMWGYPAPEQYFILYRHKEDMLKDEKYAWYVKNYPDNLIPVLRTSFVSEVVFTGPKTVFFRTVNRSLYKVEVLDETRFDEPYGDFTYGSGETVS